MLSAVFDTIPELYRFCHLAYSNSSFLKFGPHTLLSEEGPQQGDPLGPLLFCITVHPLLSSLVSNLVLGFLDDFTVGGSVTSVSKDIDLIATESARLGLHLNVEKCELISQESIMGLPQSLLDFSHVTLPNATLLGAPLFKGKALDDAWDSCCSSLSLAIDRLSTVSAHDALILLRASFSSPKVTYLMRCAPCVDHPSLAVFDNLLKSGISRITNLDLSDAQWLQASLPVRDGGLGVRRVSSLATSAFLASAASTLHLQDQILAGCSCDVDPIVAESSTVWSSLSSVPPLVSPSSEKQSAWDRPVVEADRSSLSYSFSDEVNRARLLSVSAPHSGDWLHALPISSCGLRLDDEAVRVAVGLRLGASLCVPHSCPCGAWVDASGIHSLSCRLACGRQARHHAINDIIWRALCSAGVPSTKEPVGLSRNDGKRPDGLSLIPWKNGKAVTWDVTVVNPLADSYVSNASISSGFVAEMAASKKMEKYSDLPSSYLFQPLAFETLGSLNSSGMDFLTDLGYRLKQSSGEVRSGEFLFQRISISLQRYNAIAFKGCFSVPAEVE